MNNKDNNQDLRLSGYLSPLGVWALSIGCSVGWGSFVMPGTTFLPLAGPLGTVLGVCIGAVIMLIIGVNYSYLMNIFPDAGGTYSFTRHTFGADHAFLSAWFLLLTYVAIIWANATALPLIARFLFGRLFQFGYLYEIAGFQIYLGEVLLAASSLLIAGFLCLRRTLSAAVQILMALALVIGCAVMLGAALLIGPGASSQGITPLFSPEKLPVTGVFTVMALSPWAFAGFESVSHSTSEFHFPVKKSLRILILAILFSAFAYIALALLAASALPEGCASWADYILNLDSYGGLSGLPTFFAGNELLGNAGLILLGIMALSGIFTGLIGNIIASSRLLYKLSKDDLLPACFGKVGKRRVPKNAILLLVGVSLFLPFLGRTAISWIVDVTTVGATIAYAYASASALKMAKKMENKTVIVTGWLGILLSFMFILYFMVPNLLAVTALSTESYLILASWGILGFMFFLYLFKKDRKNVFGRSTIAWIVLLAIIMFTSNVWMRQTTAAGFVKAANLSEDNAKVLESVMTRSSLIQVAFVVTALAILFYIYSLTQKRERQTEIEKARAEESSRAKSSFLSNMSHEIRTPMNAIIGLDSIALKDPDLSPRTRSHLEKIGTSARHLLGLINDILDMSRIESGKMVFKEEEFHFREFLDPINIMINGQCDDKGLTYTCRIIGSTSDYYIGDDLKLRQVLINILGNAVKFTDAPGKVELTVEQTASFEGYCTMRFVIRDTGIGMSKEFQSKVFESFSQEDNSNTNKYGSTGLGMAITKNIVEMMNGDITVDSTKGVGTTFTVIVTLKSSNRSSRADSDAALPSDLCMLIVDDDMVACEHAQTVGSAIGIRSDYVTDPKQALEMLRTRQEAGQPYTIVLSDYRMPDMNGIDFTKALRTFDKGKTCVILLTGYSWDDIQDECMEAGVDSILSKPLFSDSLLREVHYSLQKRVALDSGISSPEPEETATSERSLDGRRVLIAEDLEINAEILTDLLDMEGIEAERAENGQAAVELFRNRPEYYFDAILMDVRMPVMDGLDATRKIRALDRPDAAKIPIIAMTANAFDEDVQRSLQAGMNAHLSKPVDPERLYETLSQMLQ